MPLGDGAKHSEEKGKETKCFLRARGGGSCDVTPQNTDSTDRTEHMKSERKTNTRFIVFSGAKIKKITHSSLH